MDRSIIISSTLEDQRYNTSQPDVMDPGLYARITMTVTGPLANDWERHVTARRVTNSGLEIIKSNELLPGAWYDALETIVALHSHDQEPLILFLPQKYHDTAQMLLPNLYEAGTRFVISGNVIPGSLPIFPPHREYAS